MGPLNKEQLQALLKELAALADVIHARHTGYTEAGNAAGIARPASLAQAFEELLAGKDALIRESDDLRKENARLRREIGIYPRGSRAGLKICCAMREKFVIAIVGHDLKKPDPLELPDFVVEWSPKIVLHVRYCCWCGAQINQGDPVRTVGPPHEPRSE